MIRREYLEEYLDTGEVRKYLIYEREVKAIGNTKKTRYGNT